MKTRITASSARFIALLLLVAFAIPIHGDDWFVKGRVYHNVQVVRVNPDTVSVTYDGGTGRLALADLPPDIGKRFAPDAKKAQAFAILKKKAETDPIDHLIVSLESIDEMEWVNGSVQALPLPSTATPAELIAALHYLKAEKIAESRQIEINGELYLGVRVEAAGGEKIIIFRYLPGGAQGGFWWNRAFPSDY